MLQRSGRAFRTHAGEAACVGVKPRVCGGEAVCVCVWRGEAALVCGMCMKPRVCVGEVVCMGMKLRVCVGKATCVCEGEALCVCVWG